MFLVILYKNSINKYEIAIFCFLIIQLFAIVPSMGGVIDTNISTAYLLSYRYGVSSRGLIATVVDFFTRGGFISNIFVWHFIFCNTVFLSFIISVYLGTIIKRSKDDIKIFFIFLSLLWLSCFTAPVTYFQYADFGSDEIYAFLILFLIMLLVKKSGIRWLIPLLAIIVMSIHLILVFFYIPFIIILLTYEILEKNNRNKESIILLITTIITIIIVFLSYLLFRRTTFVFKDVNTFYEYLKLKTDLNFTEDFLLYLMFGNLEDHLRNYKDWVNFRFDGKYSILINLPLVVLFIIFWIKSFRMETEKLMKLFFLIPIAALLYQAVAFFIFFDFGRWMTMVLDVQFMLVFYLCTRKNKTVLAVSQSITISIKRNYYFVILAFIIMAFLGPVEAMGPSGRINEIFKHIKQFISFLIPF